MLQKYFPVLAEVNSPLVALIALGFTAAAAEIVINNGISNSVLETLLKEAVEETETRKQEVVVAASELKEARVAAAKAVKAARYRATQAARAACAASKTARRIKAMRRPIINKATLKGLSGLNINVCRSRAVETQAAVRTAATIYNTAASAVETALQGGDVRAIRSSVAALKAAVRLLEVRHLEFKFAREMLAISLARHSA